MTGLRVWRTGWFPRGAHVDSARKPQLRCANGYLKPRIRRIGLEHLMANVASCRVAAKAGFQEEGIRREAALNVDGWHDMHGHALLAHQPPAPKAGVSGAVSVTSSGRADTAPTVSMPASAQRTPAGSLTRPA